MPELDNAFGVRHGLSLDDLVGIFATAVNPSVSGFDAPISSLVLQTTTGRLWRKVDVAATGWQSVVSRHNLVAVTNPTTGDDSGDGYEAGSVWLNTVSDEMFICTDATAAAAVWKSTTGVAAGSNVLTFETYQTSDGEQTTTNETETVAFTYNFTPATAGTFLIRWYCELAATNNRTCEGTLYIDAVQYSYMSQNPLTAALYDAKLGEVQLALTAAAHPIEFRWRATSGGNTARIRRMRIIITRIT